MVKVLDHVNDLFFFSKKKEGSHLLVRPLREYVALFDQSNRCVSSTLLVQGPDAVGDELMLFALTKTPNCYDQSRLESIAAVFTIPAWNCFTVSVSYLLLVLVRTKDRISKPLMGF